MDNDVIPSPLSAFVTAYGADDFLLVGGVIIIVLSSIFILPSSLLDQSAYGGTFPGENGKIAFVSERDGNPEIYVMNPDGSNPTRLTNNPATDFYPSWSPDGTKIAFQSNRADGNFDIYVMNADGSGETRLTANQDPDTQPSWSPDGTKIVFESDLDCDSDVCMNPISVMNADGSGQRPLTDIGHLDLEPSWSPDGTKIVFASDRADFNFDIYVMNADGNGETRLAAHQDNDLGPSWSPDGTKIAFTAERDGNPEIYVMNGDDGSGQTRLTNIDEANDFQPSWSPDGEKIAFTSDRDGNREIYVMNAADGRGLTRLTNNQPGDYFPDWGTAPATEPPTPPVITVPEDITEEATGPDGATVTFEVSAEDDVDGPTDVECDHNSGETFPIGETVVTCSAEDLVGNSAEESFMVTVQDTTEPEVEITEAYDRRNNRAITEGSTTNMRYIEITFEATDAVEIDNTECSLDGAAFTSCTSPVIYDRVSRSTHEFIVRSTDAAGNTGEDQFTWTVRNPSAGAPGRQ